MAAKTPGREIKETTTVETILAKVKRANEALDASHWYVEK